MLYLDWKVCKALFISSENKHELGEITLHLDEATNKQSLPHTYALETNLGWKTFILEDYIVNDGYLVPVYKEQWRPFNV